MTESQVYDLLTSIFRDVFSRPDLQLSPTSAARDIVGWDSFTHVDIIMAVERATSVTFTTRDLDGLRNVGDIADVLMRGSAV